MQTDTTTSVLEAEQAKRTQKAKEGTWDITMTMPGCFQVKNQGNGQAYGVAWYPSGRWTCTCKDFSLWGDKGVRCKHIEAVRLSSPPYPVQVLAGFTLEPGAEGVKVRFTDGAEIFLSIRGRYPCSCGNRSCDHFRLATPYFARWKWETAQRPDCSWGPSLLQSVGIVPYVVRPDLVTKQSRWAPLNKGEEIAPGVRVWYTARGRLFRFSDNGGGHVYVGSDHPDGHTPCLICRDGCDHVERALALVNGDPPSPGAVKGEETEAPKTDSQTEEVTEMDTLTFEQQLEALAGLVDEWAVKRDQNVKGLYTSGEYVTYRLNQIFTPAGWSFTILSGPEVVTINQASAYVRLVGRLDVTFANGQTAHQDDVGIWPLQATDTRKGGTLETTAAERYETVEKAARTDALKNAARNLGTCFAPLTDLELQAVIKREAFRNGAQAKAEAAKTAEQHKNDLFGDDGSQAATQPKAKAEAKTGNGRVSEEQRRAIANLLSQIGYKTKEAQDGAIRHVGYDPDALTSDEAAEIIARLQAKVSKVNKVAKAVQKYS